jgi:membrane-bound lytic murein transglycosylase D
MSSKIWKAVSICLFFTFIYLVNARSVNAQMDSTSVVPSSDSTIIEAEAFEEAARVEPAQPTEDEIIAKRLKALQKEVPLVFNAKIKGFINYFSVRNVRYAMVMERRKRVYFPMFEEILKSQNVPEEIKYLAIVESGLNAKVVSPAGAAGLWQFMTFTGKEFGLKQDAFIDERLDPEKATVAACKYLSALHRTFNDWELALASYNCGPGNVRRAIRRSGYKETFWQIYDFLPKETRSYVPQFVALTYIMNHMADHNIIADSLEYPIAYDTITVNQYFDMYTFSELLNICSDDMSKLNPALRRGILNGAYAYKIKVPVDKMAQFYLNRIDILDACSKEVPRAGVSVNTPSARTSTSSSSNSSSSSTTNSQKIYYTVKSGDVLGTIATKNHVYLTDIKRWNKLSSNTIHVGQRLVIYKKGGPSAHSNSNIPTTHTARSTSITKVTPSIYYVRSGESLWTISKKFPDVSVDEIKKLNALTNNSIKVGQKLILK